MTSPTKMMRTSLCLLPNPKSNSTQEVNFQPQKSKHEEMSPESAELGFDAHRWFQEFWGLLNFTSEGDSFYAVKECKAIVASALQKKK